MASQKTTDAPASQQPITREALGEMLALTDGYDGCHQRVRDYFALEPHEQVSEGYPHDDLEQCEWWNRRADVALAALVDQPGIDRGDLEPIVPVRHRLATAWEVVEL